MELKNFWVDCVARRAAQLEQHRRSWKVLAEAMPEGVDMNEVEYMEYSRGISLLSAQGAWIRDAENKLAHAEKMLKFFTMGVW